eukprot:1874147-Alexandrium_andersonii.AAC.1
MPTAGQPGGAPAGRAGRRDAQRRGPQPRRRGGRPPRGQCGRGRRRRWERPGQECTAAPAERGDGARGVEQRGPAWDPRGE